MQTRKIIGASYWASYLINGDASGMEDEEIALCDAWYDREVDADECLTLDTDSEPFFSWHYTLHTGDVRSQGGDVLEYIVYK